MYVGTIVEPGQEIRQDTFIKNTYDLYTKLENPKKSQLKFKFLI